MLLVNLVCFHSLQALVWPCLNDVTDDEDIENDVSILARDSQVPRDSGSGPTTERTEMPGAGYLAAKNSWIASLPVALQQLAGQVLLLVENGGDAGITASFLSVRLPDRLDLHC